jgi:predicted CoA-binding protein
MSNHALLQAVHPPVDGALLMTSPAATEDVVRDCAEAGIKRVWMYRAGGAGAVSPQAVKYCEDHGIAVIPGECPFMFFSEGSWFHRFHGVLRKAVGKYPH